MRKSKIFFENDLRDTQNFSDVRILQIKPACLHCCWRHAGWLCTLRETYLLQAEVVVLRLLLVSGLFADGTSVPDLSVKLDYMTYQDCRGDFVVRLYGNTCLQLWNKEDCQIRSELIQLIAIRQSLNGIVHFVAAASVASQMTLRTDSSVGNTFRFLIACLMTLFNDSMAFVV